MRRFSLTVALFAVTSTSFAQTSTTASSQPPQSARQALIEMLLGKGPDDFLKHLPDVTRQALMRKGDSPSSIFMQIAGIGVHLRGQGHVETFDAGPIILTSENDEHEKVEATVEHDSLMGEDDEIEVSFRYTKDGELQQLPVVPRLTFTLRQEKEIWKLVDLTAAARFPLTDPDYLNGLRKQQDEENQSAAQMRVGMITGAESEYKSSHPAVGYTCKLETLFAPNVAPQSLGNQDQSQDGANQGESGGFNMPNEFAKEESTGYRFSLTGCSGSPANRFRITAVPLDSDAGLKTFCADQSGTVKFLKGGTGSACFSQGELLDLGVRMVK